MRHEQEVLIEREKDVKILEKHKEKMKEAYLAEEKASELKRLSEVAVQKHFQKTREQDEDNYLEELKQLEGYNTNEY